MAVSKIALAGAAALALTSAAALPASAQQRSADHRAASIRIAEFAGPAAVAAEARTLSTVVGVAY
ncbi:hypothetical protein [Methyloferula stellata]|uniref:hypothetical protein n=1 Tax=Methyloferula stellata TaxID=876270 RepID=UPI001267FDC9|nr:hypothetical protein [Methyloferula stellata]